MQWTPHEDQCLLRLYKEIHVYNRWKEISKKMFQLGHQKSQLQCRKRFQNKIDPSLSLEKWSAEEISKIFKLYDEYGPKWNLIEAFIPGRNQNNIKNRFFCSLKNLIRKLLKSFYVDLKYISSKDITELYEGRGKYKRFKGMLKKILKSMNYQIDIQSVQAVVELYRQNLEKLSKVITPERQAKETEKKQQKSELVQPQQKIAIKLEPCKQEQLLLDNCEESNKNNSKSQYMEAIPMPCYPISQEGYYVVSNNYMNSNMWIQYPQPYPFAYWSMP